jgi:S1-C subfamily serine protease
MTRRRWVVCVLGAWALLPGALRAAEPPPAGPYVELHRKAAPAVVAVESLGTGVVIEPDGTVLTAASVVPPRDRVTLVFQEGVRRVAKVVARDPSRDLALLRVDPPASGLPSLELAGADPPLGRSVCTLGNAFQSISRDGQVAISAGMVSGAYVLTAPKGRQKGYGGRAFEITAAVNPGMGGAPVLDCDGRVVGLVTLNLDKSRWLGMAIPASVLRPALEDLKAGRVPPAAPVVPAAVSAYLGAEVEDAPEGGVAVVRVAPGSPAARVDVRPGDRIVEFDGKPVESRDEFQEALDDAAPGTRIRLKLERGKESMEKLVELGKPPTEGGAK